MAYLFVYEGAYEITDAAFQQLEVDYFLGDPDPRVHETKLAEVPILRMYGVSEAGKVQTPQNFYRFALLWTDNDWLGSLRLASQSEIAITTA